LREEGEGMEDIRRIRGWSWYYFC